MANIFHNLYNKIFTSPQIVDALPKNKNGKNINTQVTPYALQRARQDIRSWREAVTEAESYYKFRVKMQNMYKDTILNGQVASAIRKRKNLTLLKEYAIVDKNGKIDKKATELINTKWFNDIIDYILDAQLYGYSFINWTGVENGKLIGIQTIRKELILPDNEIVSSQPYGTSGLDINDNSIKNWSLWCTTNSTNGISKCGYGLLYEVASYEIILRNLMGQNTDYLERFGMPLIQVTTDKTSDDERAYIAEMIASIGSSGSLVKDSLDQIEYIESTNAENGYQNYDNLEQRCEKKISKLLLGHADAIDSTSGKLGSEQGKDSPVNQALEEIQSVDNRFVEYYVNDLLLNKLRALGFNIPIGMKFAFLNNTETQEKAATELAYTKEMAQAVELFGKAGLSVDPKWIEEKTGIKFVTAEVVTLPNSLPGTPPPAPPEAFKTVMVAATDTEVFNYTNEHAFRLIEPGKFIKTSYRRKTIKPGIDIIMGQLIGGNGNLVTQAYRFKKDKFTFQAAKDWMATHNVKWILSEPASS